MFKFIYSEEVESALSTGSPIVALESTIISHGMPFPANQQTAQEVESVVRLHGATPATIAIISGNVHIGLSSSDLITIAKAGSSCIKCSRRNLPYVISKKLHGSTTVAATMYLAYLAGLKIFVTGGIGGVHRGAEETWDVSGDLVELGRTPITVICAGAKSILDIPKTLEYLETQGVPVIGFATDTFPAFFSPSSGCEVMCRLDTAKECANFIIQSEKLQLNNGNLIAVPLTEENLAKNAEQAIQTALEEAKEKGITGSKVTPFLLKRVNELSAGESLKANIELIKQNAMIGALISVEYYKKDIITIIGGVMQDINCFSLADPLPEGESIGNVNIKPGGVGFNLLKSCSTYGATCQIISLIGNDTIGESLSKEILKYSQNNSGIFKRNRKSSQYIAILGKNGELERAIVDRIDIDFTQEELLYIDKQIQKSSLVLVDANLSVTALENIGKMCNSHNKKLLLEPTADWNCHKIVESGILQYTSMITPNFNELSALISPLAGNFDFVIDKFIEKYPHIDVILKNGKDGVWLCEADIRKKYEISAENIKNVSGAGDVLVGYIAARIMQGEKLDSCITLGLKEVEKSLALV